MYLALKKKRILEAVVLEINIEVVSRPNVCFSDCNASRHDAQQSPDPRIVRFDVVKSRSQFDVADPLRHFYQAKFSPVPNSSTPVVPPKWKWKRLSDLPEPVVTAVESRLSEMVCSNVDIQCTISNSKEVDAKTDSTIDDSKLAEPKSGEAKQCCVV